FFGTAFGVHRSLDDGATWAPRSTGLDGAVSALYANGEDLYAGTNKGVFHSNDRGGSWSPINDGFPANFPIYKLTGDATSLIAGGTRNSVWRRPISTTAVDGEPMSQGLELSQNTPNPPHDGTRIAFAIPWAARIVYGPGSHDAVLDRFPPGSFRRHARVRARVPARRDRSRAPSGEHDPRSPPARHGVRARARPVDRPVGLPGRGAGRAGRRV